MGKYIRELNPKTSCTGQTLMGLSEETTDELFKVSVSFFTVNLETSVFTNAGDHQSYGTIRSGSSSVYVILSDPVRDGQDIQVGTLIKLAGENQYVEQKVDAANFRVHPGGSFLEQPFAYEYAYVSGVTDIGAARFYINNDIFKTKGKIESSSTITAGGNIYSGGNIESEGSVHAANFDVSAGRDVSAGQDLLANRNIVLDGGKIYDQADDLHLASTSSGEQTALDSNGIWSNPKTPFVWGTYYGIQTNFEFGEIVNVELSGVWIDTQGEWNGYQYTPTKPGFYHISAAVRWASALWPKPDARMSLWVEIHPVPQPPPKRQLGYEEYSQGAEHPITQKIDGTINLNAGEYFFIRARSWETTIPVITRADISIIKIDN